MMENTCAVRAVVEAEPISKPWLHRKEMGVMAVISTTVPIFPYPQRRLPDIIGHVNIRVFRFLCKLAM